MSRQFPLLVGRISTRLTSILLKNLGDCQVTISNTGQLCLADTGLDYYPPPLSPPVISPPVISPSPHSFLTLSGADITDYFNYGFTEETWRLYCEKQRKMKAEVIHLNKIAVSLTLPARAPSPLLSFSLRWYCSNRIVDSSLFSFFANCRCEYELRNVVMSRDVIMSILMLLLSILSKIYESQHKMVLYLATFGFDI